MKPWLPLLVGACLLCSLIACSGDDTSRATDDQRPGAEASETPTPHSSPTGMSRSPAPVLSSSFPIEFTKDEVLLGDARTGLAPILTTKDYASSVGFFPDGSVWYVIRESSAGGGKGRLYTSSITGTRLLLETEGSVFPVWSPDGSHAVLHRGGSASGVRYPALMLDRQLGRTTDLGAAINTGVWFGNEGYLYAQLTGPGDVRLMFARPGQAPEVVVLTGGALPRGDYFSLIASPNRSYVFLTSDTSVLYRVADSSAEVVAAKAPVQAGPFSPDSRFVLLGEDAEPLGESHRATGSMTQPSGSRQDMFEGVWLPAVGWSPDGKLLAAIGWRFPRPGESGGFTSTVYLVDTTTWEQRVLLEERGYIGLHWFPDSRALFIWQGCTQCDGPPHDPAILKLDGEVIRFGGGTFQGVVSLGVDAVAWSAGESVMAADSSGRAVTLARQARAAYHSLAASPDGLRVAAVRQLANGTFGLEVNVVTGEAHEFDASRERDPGYRPGPAVSPDGRRTVRPEGSDLVLEEDGISVGRLQLPVAVPASCRAQTRPVWSPNNAYVAFYENCSREAYLIDFESQSVRRLVYRVPNCGLSFQWPDAETLRMVTFGCGP